MTEKDEVVEKFNQELLVKKLKKYEEVLSEAKRPMRQAWLYLLAVLPLGVLGVSIFFLKGSSDVVSIVQWPLLMLVMVVMKLFRDQDSRMNSIIEILDKQGLLKNEPN